jgi:CubicO group peptidase (beta-lactamase class C family)
MKYPISLLRFRWYWYMLAALAVVLSGLAIKPLYREARAMARIYRSEGVSELAYYTKDRFNLISGAPDIAWETAEPAGLGLDPDILKDLGNRMAEQNTQAFLVVREGKIAYEYYSSDFGPNHRLRLSAAGKSIAASIALAVQLDAGLVDLDSPAWHFIPAWENDPIRSLITVRHLIAHTSGIENVPWGQPGLEGWKDEFDRNLSSRFPLTLDRAPIQFVPGSRVEYSSTGYYALSYILTRSLESETESNIQELLRNRIMRPLGVPNNAWRLDFRGAHTLDGLELFYAAEGRYTARAIARIGQLMLNKGTWNGQVLIRPETITALVSEDLRPLNDSQPTWGLGWIINVDGFFPSLPSDSFLAIRGSDKVMLVVPSLNLVMLRFGAPLVDENETERSWEVLDDELLFQPLMESVIL